MATTRRSKKVNSPLSTKFHHFNCLVLYSILVCWRSDTDGWFQGRNQKKISGGGKVTFGNYYDVTDLQLTMMRFFAVISLPTVVEQPFHSVGAGPSLTGSQWCPASQFEICAPPFHVWLAGCCIHPILCLKMWPPLWLLAPPAAKSWRWACGGAMGVRSRGQNWHFLPLLIGIRIK